VAVNSSSPRSNAFWARPTSVKFSTSHWTAVSGLGLERLGAGSPSLANLVERSRGRTLGAPFRRFFTALVVGPRPRKR
jgi:hypothetical protein